MSSDLTLAAIVDANPGAARVLEHHQLDYCCGGQRTLDEACADCDLDPTVVLAALDTLEPGGVADWTTMDPSTLVDHIEATHHRYLHDELPRLGALAEKVLGVHGARHPELREVGATYSALRVDLEPHLMKEEQVLFPMIRQLATATVTPSFHCGSIANPIRMMLLEHDQAGDLLARLRELTNGFTPPDDACASYQALYLGLAELEADTHLHVHKENNVLFPAVLALDDALSTP
jgi:regulator of cell morphogenesis and NO signaling